MTKETYTREQALADMPLYQCHKKARGLKIVGIRDDKSWDSGPSTHWLLEFGPKEHVPISVPYSWIERHKPQTGGYFVVYEDGYESFSPVYVFEDGYWLIPTGGARCAGKSTV